MSTKKPGRRAGSLPQSRRAPAPAPSRRETREATERHVVHLPVAEELLLFNRSWCNRSGVERVLNSRPEVSKRARITERSTAASR